MSRITTDEILALAQAHKGGKTIQFLCVDGTWADEGHISGSTGWDFHRFTYRVKPEPPKPREWQIRPAGEWGCDTILDGPARAGKGFIHVREVL